MRVSQPEGGGKKPAMSSRYVCGGFCRRTRSPHFDAALPNSRMHSHSQVEAGLLVGGGLPWLKTEGREGGKELGTPW